MEYPLSNCSTVAAVARQLGKDMQFVNLFRNTVNNVRILSTMSGYCQPLQYDE